MRRGSVLLLDILEEIRRSVITSYSIHYTKLYEVEKIRRIIDSHKPLVVDYHKLRTRRAGSEKHVDFHVVVCRQFLLQDAHQVADHLEMEVSQA